ncbi:MAG: alpha-mannosidase [Chthoniobacteraceae bacterium]
MLKHPDLTKGRLARFVRELKELLYVQSAPIEDLSVFAAPGRISYSEAIEGTFCPAKEGMRFGPGWSTHWFQITYEIPEEWCGREVFLHFNSTSEGCVWKNGVPQQGLTNFNFGPQDIRSYYRITSKAQGRERGVLYVESAINGMFGLDTGNGIYHMQEMGTLQHASLALRDEMTWGLLWDFTILKEMAEAMPVDAPHQGAALAAANEIVNAVDLDDRTTFAEGRALAAKFLAAKNGERNHRISAIGHAHIDTAWLWPMAETKRKCYRTFASAVEMMDYYPEFKFACSQAQQLTWIKAEQPGLWSKIQAKAKNGQFIPVGGTWIEPDCNVPSGESFVRQFLLGQRFFKEEFGAYCKEFWNPDVFGYSGALPQILRGAGIEFFLTQKLSWNQFNRPTNSTFLWEGIDGSRVLTHFPPSDTYNASVTVEEVLRHYRNFKENDRSTESMMLFGFGDGGGGPTEEMLERLRRIQNVAGLPEVTIRPPHEFFSRCKAELKDPIVWSGELYLELHRGTYTTQANNKRDNRRCEELLHDVEFLWAISEGQVPKDEITSLWKTVCVNQFHDILPGSSINEVYRDSDKDYASVLSLANDLRERAEALVLPKKGGENVLAINTLSWPRREVASVNGKLTLVAAPAYGYAVTAPQMKPETTVSVEESAHGFVLENGLVRAKLDLQGRLTSFFDKRHQRETIEEGAAGNQYVLFEDKPQSWDAWDVDIFHLEKRKMVGETVSAKVLEKSPLRGTIEVTLNISPRASLIQRISLNAESCRLNFTVEVDWHEKEKFLKVEFPLALRSDHATYEIQFGHVSRPTHFNTSWDIARFEVCAHKWADLSEAHYGVAVLNDSKYGYACHGNVLRLSLLRSPQFPDPEADMGHHHFCYALFPHVGGPQQGEVVAEAAAFNQPLRVFSTDAALVEKSIFSIDAPGVVLDTIKQAEDSEDIILRLYEADGAHQSATLTTSLEIQNVTRVNLLEEGNLPVPSSDGQISLKLKPFELVTLRLTTK